MSEHPSEAALQQFAFGDSKNELWIKSHISSCDVCSATVAGYQLLFSTLQRQEKPVFDFDLGSLVLQKIKPKKSIPSNDNLVFYFIGFAVTCTAAAAFYWYRDFLYAVFLNSDSLFIALLTTSATLTMIFLLMDIYNSYQRKIKALDFY